MLVRDIMNRVVQTVPPDASVQTVAALMRDQDIGAVVVVLGKQLVGIVTDRDLTIRVLGADLPASTQVVAVMSGEAICCAPDDDVKEVLRIMRLHQVRRTPVATKDRVVGIISLCDIAIRATDYDDIEMTFADLCDRATKSPSGEMEGDAQEHRELESRHI